MTSGAKGSPIQVPRSSLEATGAGERWVPGPKMCPTQIGAWLPATHHKGLSPYHQAAWALDLLEWAVAASSGAFGSAGDWTVATGHGYGGGKARLFPGSVTATRVLILG